MASRKDKKGRPACAAERPNKTEYIVDLHFRSIFMLLLLLLRRFDTLKPFPSTLDEQFCLSLGDGSQVDVVHALRREVEHRSALDGLGESKLALQFPR